MWYLSSYSSLFPILCFYFPVCYMSVGNTEYDLVVFLPEALQTRQSPEDTACQPGRDLSTDLHTRLLRWHFLWDTQKHLLGNVLISSSSITRFCLIVFSCTDLIQRPAFRCASITFPKCDAETRCQWHHDEYEYKHRIRLGFITLSSCRKHVCWIMQSHDEGSFHRTLSFSHSSCWDHFHVSPISTYAGRLATTRLGSTGVPITAEYYPMCEVVVVSLDIISVRHGG